MEIVKLDFVVVALLQLLLVVVPWTSSCLPSYPSYHVVEKEKDHNTVFQTHHHYYHDGESRGSDIFSEEENEVKSNCGPEGCKYRVQVEPQGERFLKVEAEPLIEDDPLSKPAGAETPDFLTKLARIGIRPYGILWPVHGHNTTTPRPIPSTIMPITPRPTTSTTMPCQPPLTADQDRHNITQKLIGSLGTALQDVLGTLGTKEQQNQRTANPPLISDQDRQNITQKLIGSLASLGVETAGVLGTALKDVLGALLNGKNPKEKEQLTEKEENTTPSYHTVPLHKITTPPITTPGPLIPLHKITTPPITTPGPENYTVPLHKITTPGPFPSTLMPCQPPFTPDKDGQNIIIDSLATALKEALGALGTKKQLEQREGNPIPDGKLPSNQTETLVRAGVPKDKLNSEDIENDLIKENDMKSWNRVNSDTSKRFQWMTPKRQGSEGRYPDGGPSEKKGMTINIDASESKKIQAKIEVTKH